MLYLLNGELIMNNLDKNLLFIESAQDYQKDILAQEFIDVLNEKVSDIKDARIYYNYPFSVYAAKLNVPSFVCISSKFGILIVNCFTNISKEELEKAISKTEKMDNEIYSKILSKSSQKLVKKKRELAFSIQSILYSDDDNNWGIETDVPIFTKNENLVTYLNELDNQLTESQIDELMSILDGSYNMLKTSERENIHTEGSRGAILKNIEDKIALLDNNQRHAAISYIKGPQRIRGLAGTGKTIILCMKAAYLHYKNPNAKLLYTFSTKSLYDLVKSLITRFYLEASNGSMPNFDNIDILHAWGGVNVPGVYYNACVDNHCEVKKVNDVTTFKNLDYFDMVCSSLLRDSNGKLQPKYDHVFIDEGQDFLPSFYQLCRCLTKEDCMVWCYDDLQNIFNVEIQDAIKTFENKDLGFEGINLNKLSEDVEFLNNDIVLSTTYRNPKEILVLSHSIGFGIYNKVLIQSLENNSLWEDFGYKVLKGDCSEGSLMEIERPSINSPITSNNIIPLDDMIITKSCKNTTDVINYICESIYKNITEEELLPTDICVICMDDYSNKSYLLEIEKKLNEKNIQTFNLSSNNYLKGFKKEGCVSLTSVYKAKGNECGMIYVIGCEVFENNTQNVNIRNRFFTAFTRSKLWLRIVGTNMENSKLFEEIRKTKENSFILKFKNTQRNVIKRDKERKEKKVKDAMQTILSSGLSLDELKKLLEEGLS